MPRPARFSPLQGALTLPAPRTVGGPPLYLGGQRRRGIALAAREAAGWLQPGTDAGDVAYLADHRSAVLRAMETVPRDPEGFAFVGQVHLGGSAATRRVALDDARRMGAAGATEVILGTAAALGPAGLLAAAHEVAEPLREALG